MKTYATFFVIVVVTATMLATSASTRETIPLVVVSAGDYDFEITAETGDPSKSMSARSE